LSIVCSSCGYSTTSFNNNITDANPPPPDHLFLHWDINSVFDDDVEESEPEVIEISDDEEEEEENWDNDPVVLSQLVQILTDVPELEHPFPSQEGVVEIIEDDDSVIEDDESDDSVIEDDDSDDDIIAVWTVVPTKRRRSV
jgi:hypothetical protein